MGDNVSERACKTYQHWHDRSDGTRWHHCDQLFVVTKRTRRGFNVGNVVTEAEADDHHLHVDYLNTAPHFSCDGWQRKREQMGA